MDITQIHSGNKLLFSLSGRLDTMAAPQLQAVLIPAFDAAKEVELDFSKLAYVSSAGLRVLLMGEKAAKARGGKMTLAGVSDEIMNVFEMTGFDEIFQIAQGE